MPTINGIKSIFFSFFQGAANLLAGKGLRSVPGVSVLYDSLFRIFWPGNEVIIVRGSKMYVNIHEPSSSLRHTFQTYALRTVHEESTTKLFEQHIKKGDVVLDIGANIGYFSLLAAKLVGDKGEVYSFEPEPRNYKYLMKNAKLNGYDNITAFQKAVSDKTGKINLFICPYDSGHHTIKQFKGIKDYKPELADQKESVEVDTVKLDDFFKKLGKPIDFIKLDVEGAEVLALKGMDTVLRKNKDIKLICEFFPLFITKMGNSPEQFIKKLLETYNFSIYVIGDDYSSKGEMGGLQKVTTVKELMALCDEEGDHLNLFLTRSNNK